MKNNDPVSSDFIDSSIVPVTHRFRLEVIFLGTPSQLVTNDSYILY